MFVCEHRRDFMCADGCVCFGENMGDQVYMFVNAYDYVYVYVLYVSVCFCFCIIGGYVEIYVPYAHVCVNVWLCVHMSHVNMCCTGVGCISGSLPEYVCICKGC